MPPGRINDTPEDGLVEDDEFARMSENLSSPDPSPERKNNIRLKANEDLAVALKRAVHTCDCELIREILTSNR